MNKSKYGSPPPHTPEKKKKEKALKPPQTPKGSISKQTTPPTAPSPPASLPLPNEIQGRVRFGDEGWGRGVGGASAPAFEKWRFCREGTAWAGVRAGPRPPGGRRARGRSCSHRAAPARTCPRPAPTSAPTGGDGTGHGAPQLPTGRAAGGLPGLQPAPAKPSPPSRTPFCQTAGFHLPRPGAGGISQPSLPGFTPLFFPSGILPSPLESGPSSV